MSANAAFGCAAAGHRVLPVNGLQLHALEWGAPGPRGLLFLHGGSAHCHWFDAVAPAFADRFHVLALDQRGHGESQWPVPPAYRTQDFCEDLRQLADALGWGEVTLVGHSMGGHNAMCFAAWHPERVRGLVIADSRPTIPEDRLFELQARGFRPLRTYERPESALARFRLIPRETVADPELLRHLAQAGIVKRGERWVYRFDPACNGTRQPADAWPLLARISAPTLVVRGEWSPILPRPMAAEMVKRIPGARLEEIAGTYHHFLLDRPAALVGLLERFLAGLRG
ncbi:MAG: alpha/beta hydrolase [Candidatus Rokubacteria bacterium]|nr:alpha/beta hydrolase [Candidatus Rokubacteria bacterium]